MPKRTNEFQQLIYAINLQLAKEATVTESKLLRHRLTGDEREVDVVIEIEIGPYRPMRPPHNMLYAVGESKLAKPLVKLVATSYTEQRSTLAPARVLM